jgi:hypothetical protein
VDELPPCGTGGFSVSNNDWVELIQLAELSCRAVLLDLPLMTATDARGTLLWLRGKAKEVMA